MSQTERALFIGGSHDGMIIDVELKYSVVNMPPLKDWGLCDPGQLENYRRHKFIDNSGQIIVYVLDGISEPLRHVLMEYAEMKGQK